MNKKTKIFIFIGAMMIIIIVAWIGINILDGDSHYDSSLCTLCHQNKKMEGKSYCYSCFVKAQQKVEEKNKNGTGSSTKTSTGSTSSSSSSGSGTSSTSTSSKITSSSSKTTSSSSSKKEYNDLNYDPIDYDDPDEYADDAWDEDFDSYDEAYEYWEDY